MSSSAKIWTGVVVIILIVLGIYWYTQSNNSGSTSTGAQSGQTSGATNTGASSGNLPSGSATTDAALSQDQASIDGQMSGLDSDNASMNQSFNDQPVSQSY